MRYYPLIADLNNWGVDLIHADMDTAAFFFRASLDLSKALLFGGENDIQPLTLSSLSSHLVEAQTSVQSLAQLWGENSFPCAVTGTGSTGSFLEDSSPRMFHSAFVQPMRMKERLEAYSDDPLVGSSMATVIMMFNMAVISHFHGQETEENGSNDISLARAADLNTARLFYRKALSVLNLIGLPSNSTSGCADIDLISMAIHNNLAQIAYRFYEYRQASTYCELLMELCTTVRCHDYDEMTSSRLASYCSSFLLNALHLSQPPTAAASA